MHIIYRYKTIEGYEVDFVKFKKCESIMDALRYIFRIQFSKNEKQRDYFDENGQLLLRHDSDEEEDYDPIYDILLVIKKHLKERKAIWFYESFKGKAMNIFYLDIDNTVINNEYMNLAKMRKVIDNAVPLFI